jgi:hypothetical protein
MTTKKRNELASVASMYVPLALDDLKAAKQSIRDNKPDETLKWIAEALPGTGLSCRHIKAQAKGGW